MFFLNSVDLPVSQYYETLNKSKTLSKRYYEFFGQVVKNGCSTIMLWGWSSSAGTGL